MPSAIALFAFTYQTIWVVSVTYAVWFALIVRYSAARVSVFTFLAPLFGVAAGHFILHDPLTPAFCRIIPVGNERTVRAYEQVGFRWHAIWQDELQGPVWVMLRER